jgi:hypothetical protein
MTQHKNPLSKEKYLIRETEENHEEPVRIVELQA